MFIRLKRYYLIQPAQYYSVPSCVEAIVCLRRVVNNKDLELNKKLGLLSIMSGDILTKEVSNVIRYPVLHRTLPLK